MVMNLGGKIDVQSQKNPLHQIFHGLNSQFLTLSQKDQNEIVSEEPKKEKISLLNKKCI
jgi:hypothetical protein